MTPARRIRQRRQPHQLRSEKRVREILGETARLLEQEGPNRLTTNLVARRLGMSVGTLYHYFPNKHSILHVLGKDFLDAWQQAFDRVESLVASGTSLQEFVQLAVDTMLPVYAAQPGVQHLVLAMFTIPELRALDEEQDELAVRRLSGVFQRLHVKGTGVERERRARIYLKLSNALLLESIRQSGAAARRTREDLKKLLVTLLSS